MPWCPKCRTEYREGFSQCADCGAELVNVLPPKDAPPKKEWRFKPVFLSGAENDPEKWARSTLTGSDDENLVAVYEESGRQRMWLHDVLDDYGIPYKIEVVPCWLGVNSYEKPVILVEEKNKDTVLDLIREHDDKDNIVQEETEEEDLANGGDDALPQMTCPFCGGEIDFDYAICPLCNKRLME